MATQNEKMKVAQARIKKAVALAKQGQYEKARHIVRHMEHPKAKELLNVLDGMREKPKPKSFVSAFAVMIVLVIIVGIGAFAGFAWIMNNYVGSFSLGELATFGSQVSEEEFLYYNLVGYCYDYTNYGGELCEDWADSVMATHQDSAESCFAPYVETLYSEQEFTEVRRCLQSAGIPDPL